MSNQESKIIWIAEDEENTRHAIKKLMSRTGARLRVFENGYALTRAIDNAIAAGERKHMEARLPDLIISDSNFSAPLAAGKDYFLHHRKKEMEEHGVQVIIDKIKQHCPDVPVVLYTNETDAHLRRFPGVEVTVVQKIGKGNGLEKLAKIVEDVLSGRAAGIGR